MADDGFLRGKGKKKKGKTKRAFSFLFPKTPVLFERLSAGFSGFFTGFSCFFGVSAFGREKTKRQVLLAKSIRSMLTAARVAGKGEDIIWREVELRTLIFSETRTRVSQ